MNANLLAIVNRIVAEQGEGILADSARLKPLFADYAKNEIKEDRVAFGRCIEMGAYQELKKTRTADERLRIKAALINQINAKTGIDRQHCGEALDLLEAVMFRPVMNTFPPSPQVNTQVNVQPGKAKSSKKIKNVFFAIAAVLAVILAAAYFIGGNEKSQPPRHYYYVKEDGSPDWDTFYNDVKLNAVKYNYIFVRKESTDVYEEHSLNLVGNTFYYYDKGTNYQIILRNNDPSYFGTVRRFNGNQYEAAISYFNEQLPNELLEFLQWLLLW